LESLEKELGRGLDLVLAMRRQLAVLNVRQAQTQETIRDLVQRLAASEGQTPADQTELAREASELSDTLRQIDQIIHRISNDLPRAGEYLESTMQGQLPESIPSTSGIFRRPSGGDLRPPTNG
jgi:DNA repair exonuclease SbcCD ATPase subunit